MPPSACRDETPTLRTGRADFSSRVKKIGSKSPTFFCLNVTKHNDLDYATQAALMQDFLEQRFPVRSPFERAGG